MAAGAYHGLAVDRDGGVWGWGANIAGQLGLGTQDDTPHPTPARIPDLGGIRAVAAGEYHSLALTGDGTVLGWGQAGLNGGTDRTYTPQAVAGLGGVTALVAGPYHSLALREGAALPPAPSPPPVPSPTTTPSPPLTPSPAPPLAPGQTFADVPPGYWAYDQIGVAAQRGITTGCADDALGRRLYCPERGVTRAEMATFLARTLGQARRPPPATPTFADVPTDHWAYQQIEAFATLGITTGCGTDDLGRRVFCPDRGVTRAEMAAFLDRAKGQAELKPGTPTFADVSPGYWAYGWIERAFALALTTGCGDDDQGRTVFCPDRGVTRAEMAVFILRAYP